MVILLFVPFIQNDNFEYIAATLRLKSLNQSSGFNVDSDEQGIPRGIWSCGDHLEEL